MTVSKREKIGLFGGSFDPIHAGHLIFAQLAMDYAGLERVFFIPTAVPPHKKTVSMTSFGDRRMMVQLAIADNPGFELSLLEKKDEPSFTYESVLFFGNKGYGREELHLLIGGDSLREISLWRKPEVIFKNATIVAMMRTGYDIADKIPQEASILLITESTNSISSSIIRKRIGEGRSIRYLVPDQVGEYIRAHDLYTGSS